jgi:hypothetical protein
MSLNGHPRVSATLYAQSCSASFASFRTSYAFRAGDAVGNAQAVSQPLKDLCHVRIDGGGVARRSEACTTPSETFAGTKSAIASPSEPVDERGKGRSEPKLTSHEVAQPCWCCCCCVVGALQKEGGVDISNTACFPSRLPQCASAVNARFALHLCRLLHRQALLRDLSDNRCRRLGSSGSSTQLHTDLDFAKTPIMPACPDIVCRGQLHVVTFQTRQNSQVH